MQTVADYIGYLTVIVFVGLGLLAGRLWLRERGLAAFWFATTFGVLSIVAIAGLILPDEPTRTWEHLATKILISLLLLFPYSLYRFATTFEKRSRAIELFASLSTLGLIVWSLFIKEFPAEGEHRPQWFIAYLIALLAVWTLLSLYVATRLWVGARNEPPLARNRMRLLSLGSLGLAFALILSGSAPENSPASFDVVVQVVTLAAALFFFFGFAPPQALRLAWRRRQQEDLQRAIGSLMSATDEQEVLDALLPHVAGIFGGTGSALVDKEGRELGSHGLTQTIQARLEAGSDDGAADHGLAMVALPFGTLYVVASSFTPFFGKEELELLESLGVLAGLALERCRFLEREKKQREELEQANRDLAEAQTIAKLGSFDWDFKQERGTWSDELYKIFGVTPGEFEITQETVTERVHPDDRDAVAINREKSQRTGEYSGMEYRIVRPDGSVRWIRTSGRLIRGSEREPERMIGTVLDVTEARLAEEYERELREADIRQKQALELNDNVVQGLAVAGMALELGEEAKAKEAISKTMSAAQSIITGLLRAPRRDKEVRPGDLIRTKAASLPDHRDS